MPEPLLSINELSVIYAGRRGVAGLRAADGVTFDIGTGETVALVGESGSGKSTIGNSVVGLAPVSAGTITLRGDEIASATRRVDRRRVSEHVQMVFQDPYGSLNPARTVAQSLVEPLMVHRSMPRAAMADTVRRILGDVGLPSDAAGRYPAHFSGGQRQRIAIARALMIEPELIICDEAVSALDLSVQAQVLNLLADLQSRRGVAYLFISHDVAVVRHIADRVIVLYRGRVMETGSVDQVCATPSHPYTQALLTAAPVPDPVEQAKRRAQRQRWQRASADDARATPGCPFAARCPYAVAECDQQVPVLRVARTGALAACHRLEDVPSGLADVQVDDGGAPGAAREG